MKQPIGKKTNRKENKKIGFWEEVVYEEGREEKGREGTAKNVYP